MGRTGRFALRAEPWPEMECVARSVNSRKCIRRPRNHRTAGFQPASNPTLANRSQQPHVPGMRLALKTGSYSLMHFAVAIGVTFAITQDWRAALAVGLIEPAVQTVAYLIHERVWANLDRNRASA